MVSRGRGNFQLGAILPRWVGMKCVPVAPVRSTSRAAAGRGWTERRDIAVHKCVKLPTLEAQIRQSGQGREEFAGYGV
jgi:hypothetical protein